MKRVESVIISKGGKGLAVRRVNPKNGEIENVCECLYNVDFSRGCIAQVHQSNLEEVIKNHGNYAKGNLKKYSENGLSDQRCKYCYSYQNMGTVFPRVVNGKTRKSFEEFHPEFVRLGKINESGHPYYLGTLIPFLELCKEYKTKIIFPTKALPFGSLGIKETNNPVLENLFNEQKIPDESLIKLLREVGGSLMYSIGWDKCEQGLVSQGFSNDWRISQAEKYHQAGVNTSLTIVYFISQSIDDNVRRGSAIKKGLESKERTGLNIRILPLRIKSDSVANALTGISYQKLKSKNYSGFLPLEEFKQIGDFEGLCVTRGNSELVSEKPHKDFLDLLNSGIGVCGQVGDYEHCDKCNLWQEKIAFPVSDLIPMDFSDRNRKPIKKPKNNSQKRLF